MNRVIQRGSRALVQLRQSSSVASKVPEGLTGKSLTAQKRFGPMSEEVKRLQAHFQDPMNDKPVFLQGGRMDYFWFYLTCILTVGGMMNCFYRVYKRTWGQN